MRPNLTLVHIKQLLRWSWQHNFSLFLFRRWRFRVKSPDGITQQDGNRNFLTKIDSVTKIFENDSGFRDKKIDFFRRWLEAEDVKCLNEEQVDPKLIRDLFFCNNEKKMNLAATMHLSRLHHLLVFPVFLISLCSANPVTGKNENFFCSKIFFGLGRHCCRCFNKHSSKESRCHETPLRWFTIHSAWKLRKVWLH